jgi:hypothetical protein
MGTTHTVNESDADDHEDAKAVEKWIEPEQTLVWERDRR